MKKLRIEGYVKFLLTALLVEYSAYVGMRALSVTVFLAMFASYFGDIFIMASRGCITGRKEKTFNYGIISFAAAHLLYILTMTTSYSLLILLVGILMFSVTLFMVLNNDRKYASVFYAVIIILNFINSIFYHPLAMIGMIFFIISDTILAIFEEKNPLWQIPIWITYVTAQVCIITSIFLTN